MNTIQIEIINPKANVLLQSLADMNLISITQPSDDGFMKLVNKLRAKAKRSALSMDEITKEVELVRAARYAKNKK
jgi:hypothetical protein